MDYSTILILLFLTILFYFLIGRTGRRKSARLPPGPYPLPIIGNIFNLRGKPHHSLAALSKTYGPLMSLKLGTITTIVVSSRDIAQEIFSKHDISFSSRWITHITHAVDHYKYSMVWLPVGDKWRKLRRIAKEHLFSVNHLDIGQTLRKKKVQELLDHVHRSCMTSKAVNVGQIASTTSYNVLSNFIFSIDLVRYDSLSAQDFKDLVWASLEIGGTPNLSDFFPALRPFDPQGLLRKEAFVCGELMAIFDRHINERIEKRTTGSSDHLSSNKDLTDLLLDQLYEDEHSSLGLDEIRHFFLDVFVAGTDTTSSTLEWAMAELIRDPEKMSKARFELEKVIENEERILEESDISRLPYLQAIVKETLRLHPPVTFLVPRRAITDVEIRGYIVPKDAQVIFNLWVMGRDPTVWSDAETFKPERFLDVEIDYKGQDYELIPFGAGRRMCPGLPLAHRMLHLMLGSLIYRFEWKIEGENVDMKDKFGFTLRKKIPLMAIPIKL